MREDWESIYYYGFGGGIALGAVLIYYKPDTSYVTVVYILNSEQLLTWCINGAGLRGGPGRRLLPRWLLQARLANPPLQDC